MGKKKVIILGGGITGLSTAFFLKEHFDVTVLEKKNVVGGWMQTDIYQDRLLERGPRTFRYRTSSSLLSLIATLELHKELIFSDSAAQKRFLFFQGKLRSLPHHVGSFLFSPLTRDLLPSLCIEWMKKVEENDETVFDFAYRRFGKKIAERFFDPLALGVYGIGAKEISVDAGFSRLKEMERCYGSITKALFSSIFRAKQKSSSSLISLRGGVQTIVNALRERLEGNILYETEAIGLSLFETGVSVHTKKCDLKANFLVSALPPSKIGCLLRSVDTNIADILESIPMTSLTIVHIGYKGDFLVPRGFGYLIPSVERLDILGVVFDSEIFRTERKQVGTTLTIMLKKTEEIEKQIRVVEAHLQIKEKPLFVQVRECIDAVPQLKVGHREKMQKMKAALKAKAPHIFLAGNYLQGVSVDDCIRSAEEVRETMCR